MSRNFLGIAWAGLYAADLTALVSFYVEKVGLPIVENGDGYSCWMSAAARFLSCGPMARALLI
ncbi:hypothetical protein [Pseudomonas graminis]|uniref:Uncharacterized protein n=1 Tax=Pseudomonas graminis TaxID=158627 RepID=A0A1C2EEX3_9PSED|nr:hypothetical protein [Pseudomonas graminis]OCX25500.1 hypothetical protein BBI10_02095 [Pseudomonas graminis]